jgi:DNA-directed RNA polymerase specialized sigma24 family protein
MNAMNATTDDWTQIEPLLDEAMHALDDTDRAAVLLRYFENKSLRESAKLSARATMLRKLLRVADMPRREKLNRQLNTIERVQ